MNRTLLVGLIVVISVVAISLANGDEPSAVWSCHTGCGVSCWAGAGATTAATDCCWSGRQACCGGPRWFRRRRWFGFRGCCSAPGCYVAAGCCHAVSCACDGWATCGGAWSCGGCETSYVVPAAIEYASPSEAAWRRDRSRESSAASPATDDFQPSDVVVFRVSVPTDAKLFVNGQETFGVGAEREFFSRGLEAGKEYDYALRAEYTRDGQTIRDEQTLVVARDRAREITVTFSTRDSQTELARADSRDDDRRARLAVRAPDDARIFINGQPTRSTGGYRRFVAAHESTGARLDYELVAEITRDGRTFTERRRVPLAAGESREVMFDFAATVAQGLAPRGVDVSIPTQLDQEVLR